MKDDSSGWLFLIVLVWLWTLISVEPRVSVESVKHADKVCKDNGGWKYIEEGYSIFSIVKCNNGAEFQYDWTRFNTEAYKKENSK